MTEVNASPVPALIEMFVWEQCYVKMFTDDTRTKYYFMRRSNNTIHIIYSHPEKHDVFVYYSKDYENQSSAEEAFIENGKKRLANDYGLFRENVFLKDAVENYTFYSA